jgi:hypothetical protein
MCSLAACPSSCHGAVPDGAALEPIPLQMVYLVADAAAGARLVEPSDVAVAVRLMRKQPVLVRR